MLEEADSVGISAILCFEVAWPVQHERVVLPEAADTWFMDALGGSVIAWVPVTPAISQRAVHLAGAVQFPESESNPRPSWPGGVQTDHQRKRLGRRCVEPVLFLEWQLALMRCRPFRVDFSAAWKRAAHGVRRRLGQSRPAPAAAGYAVQPVPRGPSVVAGRGFVNAVGKKSGAFPGAVPGSVSSRWLWHRAARDVGTGVRRARGSARGAIACAEG